MVEEKTIDDYISNQKIDIDTIMNDYIGYVDKIIQNTGYVPKEDTEEIISDVFLVLWTNRNKLDKTRKLSPYIAGITRNLIRKKYRNIRFDANIEDYGELLVAENKFNFEKEESFILIENLLNKYVKNEEKQIFLSYYFDDRKVKEISVIFGITESKVKVVLHRIRKKLKKELEKRGYSCNG